MKGKWKTKIAPETTNNLTTAIINFLLSKGWSASRINVQGQWDERLQQWRKSGSRIGFFDIVACINGRFVAIDIKRPGDELSKEQEQFIEEVTAAKGLAFTIDSYENFLAWWKFYSTNYDLGK